MMIRYDQMMVCVFDDMMTPKKNCLWCGCALPFKQMQQNSRHHMRLWNKISQKNECL